MNDLVFYVYAFSVMAEMIMLEIVIRQVDFSIVRRDQNWVSWGRRGAFLAGQIYLVVTVVRAWFLFWQPSWEAVGLIWAGNLILSMNVISLYHQTPRSAGGYRRSFIRSLPAMRWLLVALSSRRRSGW